MHPPAISPTEGHSTHAERAALLVILAGMVAALHVGKLPPALPLLRHEVGITLVQSGFMLSLVQFAGVVLGLVLGSWADGVGLRRSMLGGLVLLAIADAGGSVVTTPSMLLLLRACEGLGFLFVVLPAPSMIRYLVAPNHMSRFMGMWGCYMPVGTAVALLLSPFIMQAVGWRGLWRLLALLALLMAWTLRRQLPDDKKRSTQASSMDTEWQRNILETLASKGPWLVALSFMVYAGQWLAVVGFLPTLYADAGVAGPIAGALTATVALANIVGNLLAGQLLHRGATPGKLLFIGHVSMALCSFLAYAQVGSFAAAPMLQFALVVVFSAVGGLIPSTLFSMAVRVAPSSRHLTATIGWMQQLSALGQLGGPPIVAMVASTVGNWHSTWWYTVTCSALGLVLAYLLVQSKPGRKV